jgi:hypothetical protein
VVAGDRNQAVNGNHALNAMVRIQRDLQKSGEERLPLVEFATEDDLDINGDIES